jgi:hypothetical protein
LKWKSERKKKCLKKREKCKKFDEKKENRHEERMRGGDEKEGCADCSTTFCQNIIFPTGILANIVK